MSELSSNPYKYDNHLLITVQPVNLLRGGINNHHIFLRFFCFLNESKF